MSESMISRKTREQAILICALVASGDYPHRKCYCVFCVVRDINARREERELACAARDVRREFEQTTSANYAVQFAEAEALLRTGWSPK